MNKSAILTTVRTLLNDAATEGDDFTRETDAALEEFLRLALGLLGNYEGLEVAPTVLTVVNPSAFLQRPDGLYYARIPMPDDFLRLISVSLSGWVYAVSRLYPDNSPAYQAQYSSAKGVGNGPRLPMAFLTGDTKRYIEAHAVTKAGNYELRYVPVLSIDDDGAINLPDKYAGPLAYYTAALYHNSVNEKDLADSETAIAQNMLSKLRKEATV